MTRSGPRTANLLALLAALLLAPDSARAATCYAVDGEHGRVEFEIEQAGSPFRGEFRRFGGEVCLADTNVTHIDVYLEPGSVDTGLPELDEALLEPEFFAAGEHPRARFTSDRIERTEQGYVAHGTLELKGVSRPTDVRFMLERAGDRYTVSGSLDLDRLDFGIGTGEWSDTDWLGGSVRIAYEARLRPSDGGG